uniref:Uncharacterized protein n=1 Tax=Knipowitschia caucasica TaxID=637954 RepID=A0AAV2K8R3_KNICA
MNTERNFWKSAELERTVEEAKLEDTFVSGRVTGTCLIVLTLFSDHVEMQRLFQIEEISAEFMRITTVPLETKFIQELDRHSTKIVRIIRNKGGVIKERTGRILQTLDKDMPGDGLELGGMAVLISDTDTKVLIEGTEVLTLSRWELSPQLPEALSGRLSPGPYLILKALS